MTETRHTTRHADDFYSTPDWVTALILPHLPGPRGVILDPCAGDGAILDSCRTRGYSRLFGIELDHARANVAAAKGHLVACTDALTCGEPWTHDGAAVVLTNPPFVLAREFVERALAESVACVAMLLRINWLASQGRADFLRANTPSVYVLPKRPSFTGNGQTDRTDYAWMLWDGKRPTVVILPNV